MYKLKCSCGSVYNGETKKKIISRSVEHQQESIKGNWSSSGATKHTKECHGYFDWLHNKTLSMKKGIIIGKWGDHCRLIWWYSGMDNIKCWTETMRTLLRQMRENLCSKKLKHYNEIWHHFVLSDSLMLYFHQFENGFNQCDRNITLWIIKLL